MIWLGLLVSIAYIPGYTGASIPTQWAVLSCLLPLALWMKGEFTPIHWLGAAFLAYALASTLWGGYYDNVWGLWQLSVIALAFWLGSTAVSIHRVYLGLGIGLAISSCVSIANAYGYWPVEHYLWYPAGLYFNPVMHGEALTLVILALLSERILWLIPALLPGVFLSHSRGAILTLAIGGVLHFSKPLAAISLIVGGALLAIYNAFPSDVERFHFWLAGLNSLSTFGHGPASFHGYYTGSPIEFHLGHVHNDYIELAYEYGIGALPLLAIWCFTLCQTSAAGWPLFAAFAVMSAFSFPFYTPVTAAVAALAAGRIARDWHLARGNVRSSRLDVLPWGLLA